MLTKSQSSRKNYKKKKAYSINSKLTFKNDNRIKCPQLRGVVMQLRIITPKKPNSARRQCVKVYLSNKKSLIAYIHGSGHNLRKHSKVIIRGGGARDLPAVSYSCIRGKSGLMGAPNKTKRRSIYGIKRPDKLRTKLRRKYRKAIE